MIDIKEVIETNKMIKEMNLDVRTITLGISLLDCMDTDLNKMKEKIYTKITTLAADLVKVGNDIEREFGVPIVNKRIEVTPISLICASTCKCVEDYVEIAKTLDEAAKKFIGKHDFTSFATLDNRDTENMERTIYDFKVTRKNDMIEIKVSADGFLYNMVRIMVGTLLRVAQGKIKKEDILGIINAQDRSKAGPTALPCGLYLNKVFYDNTDFKK